MRRPFADVMSWVTILGIVTLVASPVFVLAWSLVDPSVSVWAELWRTRLPGMIRSTLILLVSVVCGAVILGTSMAWLVSAFQFPGRRVLSWLLVTPLAIPGYVGGFVWLDTLSDAVGARGVRSLWLCAAVLVLSLYPYVYLFARAAFTDLGADTVAAARSLGVGQRGVFFRVALPAAQPAIAAGAALVAMETLTDIGTVRLFNVSTLADGVMRVWFGTGNIGAATELASALTGSAILLIGIERVMRRHGRTSRGTSENVMLPRVLSRRVRLGVFVAVVSTVVVAVGIPIGRLVTWSVESIRAGTTKTVAGGIWHHLANTLGLMAASTFAAISIGTALALVVAHNGRLATWVGRLSTVGYAMPGPVVAVGAVVMLAALDRRMLLPDGFFLVGSTIGLVYALLVRFLAVGYQGVEASLEQIPRSAVESARVLGAGPFRTAFTVEIPAARFGILAATALLAVDISKELPITLLLRPFGVDTLSVWVWQSTSESLWAQAAVPALLMVMIGMIAVGLLLMALERGAKVVS